MTSSMFDASTLPMLEQVVQFTEARHGVLAGNIANLDTPGYRTRDLSPEEFQTRLQEAVNSRQSLAPVRALYPYPQPASSAATSFAGFDEQTSASRNNDKMSSVSDTMKGILRHDDNNSSLEEQISAVAKNQQVHNMVLSLMTAQFRLLRAAITERA